MTQAQAVDVLIQAARLAQAKGAFTLEDAAMVATAIRVFVPAEAQTETTEVAAASAEAPVEPTLEKVHG
jgi:hypothetical protein